MSHLLNPYRLSNAIPVPLQFSGSWLWLRGEAGKITHASNAISQWADSSAVGTNNANQATAGQKPTRVTDTSLDVASFTTDDVLTVTHNAGIGGANLTLVVACTITSMPSFGNLFTKRFGSTGWNVYTNSGSGELRFAINNTTDCVIKSGTFTGGRHTFSCRLNAGAMVTKWDGAGGNTASGTHTASTVDLKIGADDASGTNGATASILEVVAYDNDLGATNTATVEAYLKAYWGTA